MDWMSRLPWVFIVTLLARMLAPWIVVSPPVWDPELLVPMELILMLLLAVRVEFMLVVE